MINIKTMGLLIVFSFSQVSFVSAMDNAFEKQNAERSNKESSATLAYQEEDKGSPC